MAMVEHGEEFVTGGTCVVRTPPPYVEKRLGWPGWYVVYSAPQNEGMGTERGPYFTRTGALLARRAPWA